jgi:hypothetical protein
MLVVESSSERITSLMQKRILHYLDIGETLMVALVSLKGKVNY